MKRGVHLILFQQSCICQPLLIEAPGAQVFGAAEAVCDTAASHCSYLATTRSIAGVMNALPRLLLENLLPAHSMCNGTYPTSRLTLMALSTFSMISEERTPTRFCRRDLSKVRI